MSKQIELDATTREGLTPGALRREGRLPAVVYSRGMTPISLAVQLRAFDRVILQGGRSRLINLSLEGEGTFPVIIKELQYNPRKGTPIHVDFHRISLREKLQTAVPIVLVGEEAVLARGGVIQHQLRQLDIECLPTDIPARITLDISELEIGEHIDVQDIELPDNVVATGAGDTMVLTIVAPRHIEEPEEEDAEEVEEGEEVQPEGEE